MVFCREAPPFQGDHLLTAETSQSTRVRYVLEPKGSTFVVRAFATGLLSSFGHNPTIAIPDFQGEVQFAPDSLQNSTLRLVIPAASLTVTGDISGKDREEIRRRMHEEVLEADGFEEIIYECEQNISAQKLSEGHYAVALKGELTLHGVTRTEPISARVTMTGEMLRAVGDFSIRQNDYEIRPVSAAGGTVKLKDELKFSFDIVARKI
jgi:polyisoprenoid-binding protein YceI